jgi:hypothetical protein
MKAISLLVLMFACAHQERPLQERQLIQCYLESDTYTDKKPFTAKLHVITSEMGIVTSAKVMQTSSKDPNLSSCLSYVLTGAGRALQSGEKAGLSVRTITFRPEGKHEL